MQRTLLGAVGLLRGSARTGLGHPRGFRAPGTTIEHEVPDINGSLAANAARNYNERRGGASSGRHHERRIR